MQNKISELRLYTVITIALLALQYGLGMAASMFTTFPEGASAPQLWAFAWAQPLIMWHIIVGSLLPLVALLLCVRAVQTKRREWVVPSVVGFVAMLAAGGAGSLFVQTQIDAYSYIMSIAFLVSFAAYFWGLYRSATQNQQ